MAKRKVAAIAGVAALAAGLATWAGVATAAIPDSGTGKFTACVASNGDLRPILMIDKQGGINCPTGFDEKSWSGGFQGVKFITVTWHQKCADEYGIMEPYAQEVPLPSGYSGVSANYVMLDANGNPTSFSYGINPGTNPVNNVAFGPTDPRAYHTDTSGQIDGLNVIGQGNGNGSLAGCQAVTWTNTVQVYATP